MTDDHNRALELLALEVITEDDSVDIKAIIRENGPFAAELEARFPTEAGEVGEEDDA